MAWLHQATDLLTDSLVNQQNRISSLAVTGSFAFGILLVILRWSLGSPHQGKILASPLTTLVPSLSDAERKALPLPPDVFPGSRDVATPYGSIRVYEWGPEDGAKVLFVHGITTPCLALGGIAHVLADRGCRVMLFDLFGRGYSDAPSDLPQDPRLFITQILLVLASSPLSWTGIGSGRFCLVGYSLGGGIAAVFASYFGQLLSSLVLLAPSGLLRDSRINFQSRLLYSQSLIPDALLKFLVAWRLRRGPLVPDRDSTNGKTVGADDALVQELPEPGSAPVDLLSRAYPTANIRPAVSWQVRSNAGFVHSFISSMRHGPILQRNELPSWRRLGKMLTQQRNLSPDQELQAKGLRSGKVLVMCAKHDAIIARDELVEDATAALEGNVEFRFFNAGHEFGSTKSNEVALQIMEFWGWTT